ncbi:ABC transporter ATP-binding protein [Roseateles koreensis]|uniref:Spermidine/putrescine import ATP-binding protein PotA n=1 Tax=Roseateles koreensis TaxID=2987526 RepID=A0ABT5KVC2_9BURK|nr:ABC transporter ATP-binding protein [Roseateles koreensis]MDC8786869.1 ABC transporter ATP-binding protein [Roseateles koreensis]
MPISTSASQPAAPYLRLENVVKDFGGGAKAVAGVSLDIQQGEIFALLGSSGCGKTTLLRILAGFETPTSGRILLNGCDLAGLPPYARPINMMFQSYALFPHLSVWDNIAFGLRREQCTRAEISARVDAILKLVQLGHLAKRKPHQLSGGQQQRVALARSLVKAPKLLLLDEPLGALDKKLREETQIELVNIIRQVGVTCVMVTHDQEEAMTMATRIGIMSEGLLQQVAPPAQIYETPANRFVADFIGNVNMMEGTLVCDNPDHVLIRCADCQHLIGHGISGSEGMAVAVALRPEKITLSRQPPAADASAPEAVNCVSGRLEDLAYFGAYTVYRLRLPSGGLLKVSMANTERHPDEQAAVGETCWARWSDSAAVVLTH